MGFFATTDVQTKNRFTRCFRGDKSENRLVSASNGSTVVTFAYDYMGRRYRKAVGSTTNRFVYDGWALIREDDGTVTNSYVYGVDLSGSMQGAGTIGGILSADLNDTNVFYCCEANGNVTELADTNGTTVATYIYGPFGGTISQTGALADSNPFRFSSKYLDDQTDLYYYGLRHYNPELSRWNGRDPIGERGGLNLYGFVGNTCINKVDVLGLVGFALDCEGALDEPKGKCGKFLYTRKFSVKPAAAQFNGVVQYAEWTRRVYDCKTHKLKRDSSVYFSFYELIFAGPRGVIDADEWKEGDQGETHGYSLTEAKSAYFDVNLSVKVMADGTPPWVLGGAGKPVDEDHLWIPLPDSAAYDWGEPDSKEKSEILLSYWNCCCKEEDTTIEINPFGPLPEHGLPYEE